MDNFGRTPNHWKVQCQRQDGQIVEQDVFCHWTPDKDFVLPAVINVGAALAAFTTRSAEGACIPHAGLSAILVSRGLEAQEEIVQ